MRELLLAIFIFLNVSSVRCVPKAEYINHFITQTPDTISYLNLGIIKGNNIYVEHDINLNGRVCKLPGGMGLCQKGGIINNGTIIGNNTHITGKGAIFNKVIIKGSWNVPKISTRLFTNLDEVNSLRQVVALANPHVKNSILIEEGNYIVKAKKHGDICIPLCSNTDFTLNGSVSLEPNDFERCYIILAKGKNIRIKGKGTLKGDRFTHIGKTGEWGMGLAFKDAFNSSVCGLTIQECWGDCIIVDGKSKDILIEKCILNHGRRQGISVTMGEDITIRNCKITNVKGTNPQYAIDIEPDRGKSVDRILIENVVAEDCMGGFMVYRLPRKKGAKLPWVGSVTIRNCQVHSPRQIPVRVTRCDSFKIEECTIYTPKGMSAIKILNTGKAEILNNTIKEEYLFVTSAKRSAKKLLGKKNGSPICISDTKQYTKKGNKIFKNNVH